MIDVEPLIVSELERMLPLPDGGRADWSDVLAALVSRVLVGAGGPSRGGLAVAVLVVLVSPSPAGRRV